MFCFDEFCFAQVLVVAEISFRANQNPWAIRVMLHLFGVPLVFDVRQTVRTDDGVCLDEHMRSFVGQPDNNK